LSETTDVLSQAVEEIKRLRHDNEILHALLDVQIVTWRLRGLFNVPEEEDEY